MYDMPNILEDYLNYMETIKGLSPNTVKEYFFDLRTFFRFIKVRYKLVSADTAFDEIEIRDVNIDIIRKINIQDFHAFISYLDKAKNNGNYSKSRKIASLKSFFKYLYSTVNLIDKNPADKLEFPKTNKRHPTYLTLEECERLLKTILENKNELYRRRDFAIVILFLNCGLRLSELASINISKIKEDTLTVIGKEIKKEPYI